MPGRASPRIPSYRLHKPSGLAVVRLNGHDIYLGEHGTAESRKAYERVITQWLANGRHPPGGGQSPASANGLAICELMLAYLDHARGYYVKNGTPTGEYDNIRDALRPVAKLYDKTSASSFGPQALRTVRQAMIEAGLARSVINARVNRIRRMFRWGVENELVAPAVLHGIQAVAALRQGRSEARETAPVKPVSDDQIMAVLEFVPRPVAAMIQLQRLTGMRPGEVMAIRRCDIEVGGRNWVYRPVSHKTQHHGKRRVIFLGPRAQHVLEPFLDREPEAYLFRPSETVEELHKRRRATRKTPLRPSQASRTRMKVPHRRPGARYTRRSYAVAIARACDRVFPPPPCLSEEDKKLWRRGHRWSPNKLRHTAATDLRQRFGIESARVVLGHSSSVTTEIYAALDESKAAEIMEQVG